MFTLIPASTDVIIYTPKYEGALLESEPTAYSVTVYDYNGNEVTFNSAPVWNATDKTIELPVVSTDIGRELLHTVLTFQYEWTYDSQTLTDIERGVVSNPNYGDLVSTLRRKLKDTGEINTDDFPGDGTTEVFNTEYYPLKVLSEMVLVDNVRVSTPVDYTINYDGGLIAFTNPPAEGSTVRVTYVSYEYGDFSLEEYLSDAVAETNQLIASSISQTEPVVLGSVKNLVVLLAQRSVYTDEMMEAATTAFSWREEEKTIDKRFIANQYKASLELLNDLIDREVKTINQLANSGAVLSGGQTPLGASEIDWTAANA